MSLMDPGTLVSHDVTGISSSDSVLTCTSLVVSGSLPWCVFGRRTFGPVGGVFVGYGCLWLCLVQWSC